MVRRIKKSRREVLAGVGALGLVAGCGGPSADLVGIEDPSKPPEAVAGATRHRVLIATTRARAPEIAGAFYANARSETLNFAAVDVYVPPNHQLGVLERPSRLPPDPERHFVITNPRTIASETQFRQVLTQEERARPVGRRTAMIFVHGYNQTLSEAVLHLAQFVEDTGYRGVPILFSFASSGRGLDYLYDVNSAIIARDAFEDLRRLVEIPAVEGVEIFAHSMGNVVVMEALRQRALAGQPVRSPKLRGIVMASPDIDLDLFMAQLAAIPMDERAFVVLTSEDDRALRLSQRLSGGQVRVGRADPDTLAALGVAVIDLSQVDDVTSSHHSKFSESDAFVRQVGVRLRAGDQFGTDSVVTTGQAVFLSGDGSIETIGDGG